MEIPEKVQKHAAWLPWFSGAKRKPKPPHIAPSLWPSSAWMYCTMECLECQRSLCDGREAGRYGSSITPIVLAEDGAGLHGSEEAYGPYFGHGTRLG